MPFVFSLVGTAMAMATTTSSRRDNPVDARAGRDDRPTRPPRSTVRPSRAASRRDTIFLCQHSLLERAELLSLLRQATTVDALEGWLRPGAEGDACLFVRRQQPGDVEDSTWIRRYFDALRRKGLYYEYRENPFTVSLTPTYIVASHRRIMFAPALQHLEGMQAEPSFFTAERIRRRLRSENLPMCRHLMISDDSVLDQLTSTIPGGTIDIYNCPPTTRQWECHIKKNPLTISDRVGQPLCGCAANGKFWGDVHVCPFPGCRTLFGLVVVHLQDESPPKSSALQPQLHDYLSLEIWREFTDLDNQSEQAQWRHFAYTSTEKDSLIGAAKTSVNSAREYNRLNGEWYREAVAEAHRDPDRQTIPGIPPYLYDYELLVPVQSPPPNTTSHT